MTHAEQAAADLRFALRLIENGELERAYGHASLGMTQLDRAVGHPIIRTVHESGTVRREQLTPGGYVVVQ